MKKKPLFSGQEPNPRGVVKSGGRGSVKGPLPARWALLVEATFYHWRAKYGGLEVNEARWLRQLEEENGRLSRIVAQQAPDLDALKTVLAKSGRRAGAGEARAVRVSCEVKRG